MKMMAITLLSGESAPSSYPAEAFAPEYAAYLAAVEEFNRAAEVFGWRKATARSAEEITANRIVGRNAEVDLISARVCIREMTWGSFSGIWIADCLADEIVDRYSLAKTDRSEWDAVMLAAAREVIEMAARGKISKSTIVAAVKRAGLHPDAHAAALAVI